MGRTKHSYEEVKAAFEARGYELLTTEYKGVTQKLEYICPKHRDKGVLTIDFKHLIERGQGCKYCAREKPSPLRIQDDVLIELCNKNNFTFVKSEVVKGKTIVYYVCNIHKNKGLQHTSIGNLRNKRRPGCLYCLKLNKKTHAEFTQEISEKLPNIILLTEYINADSAIKCKCNNCGYEWTTTPNRLLSSKYGCIKCARKKNSIKKTKTQAVFEQELHELKPYILPVDPYTNVKKKILFYCMVCGSYFYATPDSILHSKYGCPTCAQNHTTSLQTKTHEQFIKELKMVNPNIIPLESYKTDRTKIKCHCLIHNYTWMATPNKLLHRRTGCPKCTVSSNENKICELLDLWGYDYVLQKSFDNCRDKHALPFDIYIPQYNILIEYDGEGHYIPIKRSLQQSDAEAYNQLQIVQYHDEIKTDYCMKNNIPLIRIPYWENDDLEYYLFNELVKYGAIDEIA